MTNLETLDPMQAENYNPAVLLAKLNALIEEYNDLENRVEEFIDAHTDDGI